MSKIILALSTFLVFNSGYQVAGVFLPNEELLFSMTIQETSVKKIVKRIEKVNMYVVTPMNSKNISDQERNYVDLLRTASIEELTQLAADHKSAVVRLYAFRALMESVKDAPKHIFEQFMNDTTLIKVINETRSETKPLNSIAKGFLY